MVGRAVNFKRELGLHSTQSGMAALRVGVATSVAAGAEVAPVVLAPVAVTNVPVSMVVVAASSFLPSRSGCRSAVPKVVVCICEKA